MDLKDRLIADFSDDSGADTLKRYFAQIEYTAFWCIRMLRAVENIEAVVPESFDDVVIIRPDQYELHQVKTRDESMGPWTNADIYPILGKQYAQRHKFDRECTFYFVSNQNADTKTTSKSGGLGALWDLKRVLEVYHLGLGYSFTKDETQTLDELKNILIPKLQKTLKDQGIDLNRETVEKFLLQTNIETDSEHVHYPNDTYIYSPNNIIELECALANVYRGEAEYVLREVQQMYERLLSMVYERIRTGRTLNDRKITAEDVKQCRVAPVSEASLAERLENVPGRTLLDKKAYLGGFDSTRRQNMYRQRTEAEAFRRRLADSDLEVIESLTTELLDMQITCREVVSKLNPSIAKPGPEILRRIRPRLMSVAQRYFPERTDLTEQVFMGMLWNETNACRARWNLLSYKKES